MREQLATTGPFLLFHHFHQSGVCRTSQTTKTVLQTEAEASAFVEPKVLG